MTIAMLELNTSDSNSNASSDSVYTSDSHDGKKSDSNDGNWEAKTQNATGLFSEA